VEHSNYLLKEREKKGRMAIKKEPTENILCGFFVFNLSALVS